MLLKCSLFLLCAPLLAGQVSSAQKLVWKERAPLPLPRSGYMAGAIGGKYVVAVSRFTIWQGESNHHTATSKDTAEEIIQWLKDDSQSETLGAVSQEAVEDAVSCDKNFAAAWVEVVE